MAGLAELHAPNQKKNDFWSWRSSMYALALSMSPEQMESIAAMLYQEMLRHGYTHVAEFHYIHHDKDGKTYNNKAELSERIASAAQKAGINLTLIPIYYEQGGFGIPAQTNQRRFLSKSLEDYLDLYHKVKEATSKYPNCSTGMGIHSLRGVALENIIGLAEFRQHKIPFHMHVAEQLREIEACKAFTGLRPTEWVLQNIDLNEDFHLVHATHLNNNEVAGLAKSKANVVLCPSTEGNLGDGLFSLDSYLTKEGNWSIGTDSQIGLNPFEELRLLDYGQRLISHRRNTFGNKYSGDNGALAIQSAFINGSLAMGNEINDYFQIGKPLNALVMSSNHPLVNMTGIKNLTNTFVYASDPTMNKGTIVNGSWKILDNKAKNNAIQEQFLKTMKALSNRI
jgi:formimidoylglutamate deiminase